MTNNLILDCDGVLYPLRALHTTEIVSAVKDVYRTELKLSGEQQKHISRKTIRENHLGLFNYIREICNATGYNFDLYCREMVKRIDYSAIQPDQRLWQTLQKLQKNYNIVIWTNGCRPHLDQVFNRVFAKNTAQVEEAGIRVFDIMAMEKDGYFYPKQSDKGFDVFFHKTGFRAADCTLFDDTPRNLEQTEKHGVKGVLITDDLPLNSVLQTYTGSVINHTKATYEHN